MVSHYWGSLSEPLLDLFVEHWPGSRTVRSTMWPTPSAFLQGRESGDNSGPQGHLGPPTVAKDEENTERPRSSVSQLGILEYADLHEGLPRGCCRLTVPLSHTLPPDCTPSGRLRSPAARAWICDRRPAEYPVPAHWAGRCCGVMCPLGTAGTEESRPSKRTSAAWCSPNSRMAEGGWWTPAARTPSPGLG